MVRGYASECLHRHTKSFEPKEIISAVFKSKLRKFPTILVHITQAPATKPAPARYYATYINFGDLAYFFLHHYPS